MRIGYIGLGNMGGALAGRLLESREITVYDKDTGLVEAFAERGARPTDSGAEVAAASDIVFLCLPNSDLVELVLFGDEGIASTLRAGAIIVDQTTGYPPATREFARRLAETGIGFVDAPVSGGVTAARAGTIAIMVGAEDETYSRVEETITAISPKIFRAGGIGCGQVIKLANNLLSHTQRLLSLEALALADKNGVDPRTAHEILTAGGGSNAFLEKSFGPRMLRGDLCPGFTMGLAHKDVRLAGELARQSGVPSFYGALSRELYQLLLAENGADSQVDTAARAVDRWAGTAVVPAAPEE
ncbi:NAD(P)-dependent oxidoreductase [Brevibacterium sp. VCM10]|uniref:NAD(P)-dependent oxidoreductase n=1 Tax=Brevibacterium sp. VCM10 TaxID=1381751 RepID=UPI00046F6685|nr:NAD(P)-dependent oxidoreductase [Brevibacterium sp. VCM10]